MSATLPPLPETTLAEIANRVTRERELSETGTAYYGSNWEEVRKLYTEAQMRAYGAECARAEREACALLCEGIEDEYQRRESHRFPELRSDAETGAGNCAAAIRARSEA